MFYGKSVLLLLMKITLLISCSNYIDLIIPVTMAELNFSALKTFINIFKDFHDKERLKLLHDNTYS